jgi:hypothetical protein
MRGAAARRRARAATNPSPSRSGSAPTLDEAKEQAPRVGDLLREELCKPFVPMQALGAIGALFPPDDFGAGPSSLACLRRLPPPDPLQIDRSSVPGAIADPDGAAIVRTALSLAERLSLDVLAEGVETVERKQSLAGCGCGALQGHLFGEPAPVGSPGRRIGSAQQARAAVREAKMGRPGPAGGRAAPAGRYHAVFRNRTTRGSARATS